MISDRRTRAPGRGTTRRLIAALSIALAAGCGGDDGNDQPAVDGPDLTIAAAVGDTDFFDIQLDLGVAFCSTAVGCPATLGGQTKPSLVTGATCSMPSAWDGFLLYARRLACYGGYTGGSLTADPTTWTGEAVVADPATTTEERAYSAVIAANDTEYVNTTQYLEPLTTGSPSHCYYEAEALVVPTALDASARQVYHRENPARMTWDVVIEPTGASTFDCHFGGSPILSGVDVDYPASVTVSRPSPTTKGSYPATFDYATIAPVTLNAGVDFGAARVRYVLATTMPVQPSAVPTWAERDLWVKNGASALDADIDSTCVRTDPSTGALVSIGVLLRKASDSSLFGLVEVLSDDGGTRFDCVRAVGGECTYTAYTAEPGGAATCADVVGRCHDGAKNYTESDIDCGGVCPGCAVGDDCTSDADCLSGYCDGGTSLCVAQTSCLALYTARTSTPSGRYQLDPDGAGGEAPFMAYCDMTSGDAGWTLVMKLSTNTQNLTFGDAEWTGTGLLNAAYPGPNTRLETSTDAKYPAYNTVTGDTLRLDWLGPAAAPWTYPLGGAENTALDVFSGAENVIAGDETYAVCHSALLSAGGAATNYDASLMRFTTGAQFYGVNGDNGDLLTPLKLRWGYGSNDEVVGNPLAGGQPWEPRVGIGGTSASILWTVDSDHDNCADYGSGTVSHTAVAGNLWIK